MHAALTGDLKIVKESVESGIDVNLQVHIFFSWIFDSDDCRMYVKNFDFLIFRIDAMVWIAVLKVEFSSNFSKMYVHGIFIYLSFLIDGLT